MNTFVGTRAPKLQICKLLSTLSIYVTNEKKRLQRKSYDSTPRYLVLFMEKELFNLIYV